MGRTSAGDQGVADDRTSKARGLKPSRAIGGSLNALIRATALYRKGVERFQIESGGASDAQKKVAERAARAWRNASPNTLEIESTHVSVGGELALEGDNEYASWILYAFMAGVRKITPKRAMTTNDVIRLVQALVELRPTLESIERFRDWLDADGAEGFEVRVQTSFSEVMEEVDLEEDREFSKAFSVARFEVPQSGDSVYIAARDLDRVAMRREFEVPIEMYAQATAGAGGLSEEDMDKIGKHCDDANAWATAELHTVLALPALRNTITPEHMARRVVTRLSEEADERFLMLLTQLNKEDDPFRKAVADALATDEVGEIIARQLQLEGGEESVEALGRFLVLSPPGLAQTVVLGVLGRAVDDQSALKSLLLLAQWYKPAQICEWIVGSKLDIETGEALGKVLSQTHGAPNELTHIIQQAPAEAGLALVQQLPTKQLKPLGSGLRFLFGRAKGDMVEEVAAVMIAGRAKPNLKALGDRLLDGNFNKWQGKTLYALGAGLIECGFGRSHVLELAMSRSVGEKLRLIALDCISNDDELVDEASRFRVSNMLESATIRQRLKKLAKDKKARQPA